MDEQRAWVKSRRKKRLRILAAALAFCLLFTTYPNILETLSVFAAGTQSGDGTEYVTGFAGLPEEVREQTVPVGTGTEELMLPDTLEATVAIPEGEVLPEDAEEETGAPPESAEEETEAPPEGTEEETESSETEGTETEESADNTQPEEEADGENAVPDHGDDQTEKSQGTEPEASEEAGNTESEEGQDTEPEEAAAEAVATEEAAMQDNSDNVGDSGESAPSVQMDQTEDAEPTQETHTVTMPEYQAENVITAETIENAQEIITIEDITWQSEPAYDGNAEGIYIFTAVLPEEYALMEGVSLPQITVTVQADSADSVIQALLERIAALPDVAEYLAGEPETEAGEEAYAEWMGGLYGYAGEALDIQEACEALTEEQKAQIPEEAFAKLAAWVELAETAGERAQVLAVPADAEHNHATALTSGNSELTGGNYYLEGPVTLTSTLKIKGNVSLCLNGQKITYSGTEGSIIEVENGANFHLYDCSSGGTGTLTSSSTQIVKYGGGVCVQHGGIFTMHGGTITGCEATYGGGVINSGTFTMSGGTISGNTATIDGGGVYVKSGGTFTMDNGTISGNTAKTHGGGVCVNSGTFTMSNGTITNNGKIITGSDTSTNYGGGVYVNSGTFEMSGNSTISGNTASTSGGGVYVAGGTFNMNGGKISGNTATYGGGVYVTTDGTLTMSGSSTISNNTATKNGGGVYSAGPFTMSDGTISGNTATNNGGGVCVNSGTFTMTGGTITNNGKKLNENDTATQNGGGVYVKENGTFTMSNNSMISGNAAKTYGGGVFVDSSGAFTMSGDSTISGNKASTGGGVYVNGNSADATKKGTFKMSGGTISGNTATNNGGGVYVNNGTFTMNSGTISGNTATTSGGGVCNNGEFTMTAGTISGNEVEGQDFGGGGVYSNGTFNMNGGTISGNTAETKGGGVYVTGSSTNKGTFNMSGGTISGNKATGTSYGGGVFVDNSGAFTMSGGMISKNTATNYGGGVYVYGSYSTFTINGTVNITGNKKSDGSANNVYLPSGKTITLGTSFNADSTVGVTTESKPSDCNTSAAITSTNSRDFSDCFLSDNTAYTVKYVNSSVALSGGHNWSAGSGSITCSKCSTTGTGGNCGASSNESSVTWLVADGVLTISGTGAMKDYGSASAAPWNNESFSKVVIKDGVTSIGSDAFNNYTGLKSITIPSSVKSIGQNTFYGCTGLTSITIPSSVTEIGLSAFYNCSNLATIEFTSTSAPSLRNSSVFGNCTSLTTIIVPCSWDKSALNADYWKLDKIKQNGHTWGDDKCSVCNAAKPAAQTHKVCNDEECTAHSEITWTAWTETTTLPSTTGNYYLTDNVNVSSTTEIASGNTVSLCLNGQTVTSGNGYRIYTVKGTLNLSNCKTDGKLIGKPDSQMTPNGGGVFVEKGGTFNMYGGTITGFNATGNGGGVYVDGDTTNKGTFNMNGGTISGNTATNDGGGVFVANGTFTMSGGTISGNTATNSNGGGVYVYDSNGTFTMNSGIIEKNTAANYGGVYVNGGTFEMKGGTIGGVNSGDKKLGNTAKFGGGVFVNGFKVSSSDTPTQGTFEMKGGTISGNTATTNGGGVYVGSYGAFTMNSVIIEKNTAANYGGGVFVNTDGTFTMSDGTISGNTATGNCGGGVFVSTKGTFTMSGNSTISGNIASFGGGGVYVNSGIFTMDNGTISGNKATQGGGVYVNTDGTFNMNGGTISGNTAPSNCGGGVFVSTKGTFNMNGGTIGSTTPGDTTLGNTAGAGGGGVYSNGTFTMKGSSKISGNSTTSNPGGGVYVANGTFTMSGGSISGNTATTSDSYGGGGVYVYTSGTFKIDGTVNITENTSGKSASKSANNVYLENGETIALGSNFNAASTVGVTIATTPSSCNDPVAITDKYASGGFTPDNADYTIKYEANNAVKLVGGHTWSATSTEGSTKTYTCSVCNTTKTEHAHKLCNDSNCKDSNHSDIIWTAWDKTDSLPTTTGNYYLTDNVEVQSGTTIESGNTVSLCLNGHTVTSPGGYRIYTVEGTLNLSDCQTDGKLTFGNAPSGPDNGGGVYVASSGIFNMYGGTITGCKATYGGGVFVNGGGKFTMSGGTIGDTTSNGTTPSNTAKYGGGVYVAGYGEFTMSGGTIEKNTATNNGGGVYVNNHGTFTMYGGTISGNKATSTTLGGGGVFVNNAGTFTMSGGTISGNNATNGNGGGVFVAANSKFEMSGGTITNNGKKIKESDTATIRGGGVYVDINGTFTMSGDSTISNNTAIENNSTGGTGGGVYSNGTFNMTGGTIGDTTSNGTTPSNTAKYGGGVYVAGGTFNMSGDSKISGNTSTNNGGGVYVGGTFEMQNGTISGNNATSGNGGGVYVASSGTFNLMSGGTITNNGKIITGSDTATIYGGGVYVANTGTFNMKGGTISGNTATNSGGGVYSKGTFEMSGGKISDNTAYRSGGGVITLYGTFNMSGSSEISGNTAASQGGGVYVNGGTFTMEDGKISNNTSNVPSFGGGGVYVTGGGKFTMNGGEITGNKAPETTEGGGGVYLSSGEFKMTGGTIGGVNSGDTTSGNTAKYGGGVYVAGGTFNMSGDSKISGNTATSGGGVFVNTSGTFTMSDGTISGNNATNGNGGGVCNSGSFTMSGGTISGNKVTNIGGGVCNSGSFTMSGGTISGNEATGTTHGGGGVFVDNTGAFTMSGGMISGNNATNNYGGGVYVNGNGAFTIDGTVNITGNTSGGNVYLPNDKIITIGSSFDAEKTTVGVTTETTPTSCADSASVAITDKYVSGGFTSDNTAYTIAYAEGSAAKLTKEHKYKYSVSNEKSYENCEGCNHHAIATLTIPENADLTYTGSEITPATITYSGNEWVGTKPTISYSANINVGNAQAKINCGNIAGNKTFAIKPKSLTAEMVTVIPNEVIGGTPTVTVQDGTALTSSDYTVNYDATTATVTVTGEGNYTGTISKKVPKKLPTGETLQSHAEIKTPSVSGTDNLYNSDITIEPKDGWTVGTDPDNLGSSLTITEETGPEGTTIPIYLKDPDGNIYQTEYTYTLDKTAPAISGSGNLTVDGGNISFTPTEGGKAYWIISDTEPTAAEVKKNGTAQEITGGTQVDLDVTAAEKGKTVYVVLEDAAGNLSDVVKTEIQAQAHSHTLEHFPAKEATETVEGNVEYWHCSVCGKNFSDEDGTNEITNVTIPATSQIPTLPEGTDFEKDCVTLPEPIGGSTGGTGGTDNLYGSDITITPKDGWEVGTDPNKLGSSVSFTEETGRDGKEVTLYLKDKDGNVYKKEFTYTLDKSAPAVDLTGINLGTGSGSKVDKQIIGKKDTVIKIPASGITDNTSDIKKVSYTATTDGGTAKSGTLTKNGDNYEIALKDIATGGDFVGTIVLTVEDSAGHSKTVTLPADGGKIIVEEHSPVVKPVAQPSTDPSIQPNDDGWYNKNFDLTVTVTDDKGTTGAAITSGGIAKIEWKDGEDGEVHTVTVPTESGIVGTKEFTLPTSDGEHTYYVNVVDNAGNSSGWREYATVKVDTQEPAFSGKLTVTNQTGDGANISFTPTESGKAYWIVSDTVLTARQVKEQSAQNGGVLNITGGTAVNLAVTAAEKAQTVYVVLEDAAGNLSNVVKAEISAQAHTHNLTKVNLVEPTETTAGNVAYWRCSGCGKLYEDEQGITETDSSKVTIRITGDGFWYVITPDGVKIVGYSGSDTTVEVPSEIGGKPVTAIGANAFAGKTGITSVTIPDSVTAIGKGAFSGCTGLTTVMIPEGLDTTKAGITDTAAKVTYRVDEDGKITITSVTPGKDNNGKDKPVTLPETIGGKKPEISDAVKADTDDGDNPDDEQPTPPSPVQPTPQPESPVQPTPQPENPVQPTDTPDNKPENEQKPEDKQKPDDTPGQGSTEPAQTEGKASEPVQVTIDGGKLTMTGDPVTTGNITETSETMTTLAAGDGAVVVTVVCEEETCTAEVCDTVAVANAVLLSEQIELVNDGETIEIRVEVKDISETVSGQDKEIIESGLAEYRKEMPGLTLGMYVDISVFVRGGEGDWNAVTSTEEPIEVVIGIPEELKGDGREFYIIRSHDGEYTLLPDTDDNPDTITVSTDMFSAYALVYKQADRTEVSAPGESGTKCGLCHICPTFLGICCFIWLAVIVAVFLLIGVVIWRKRQEEVFQ